LPTRCFPESRRLIRRLRRAKIARQKVQVFKPEVDSRYSNDHFVCHSEMRHESSNIRTASELLATIEPDTQVVGIDEGQFFDNELIDVANQLAKRGVRIIIA
jgi:thymidine kinase